MIREKSTLPRYGNCWKAAVETIDDGCRHLSEETQSDIALKLTNCFLEMSGQETYNCEQDIKPNIRTKCMQSMSDKAFNAYTEFYTHTQNICWFLRGQIWHETITTNTLKVGEQLKESAANQEELLAAQKESLMVQERILQHGKILGNVLEELAVTTSAHQEILRVTTDAVANLQAFVVGEASWFNSLLYYCLIFLCVFILTSVQRTYDARIPLFVGLLASFMCERFITQFSVKYSSEIDAKIMYNNLMYYIWILRYLYICIVIVVIGYFAYYYKNLLTVNNSLLTKISKQNKSILDLLLVQQSSQNNNSTCDMNVVNENNRKLIEQKLNNLSCVENELSNGNISKCFTKNLFKDGNKSVISEFRYNLRSRQGTPDSNK